MSQVSLGRPEFVPGTPPGHPTAKFLYVIFLYRFFSLLNEHSVELKVRLQGYGYNPFCSHSSRCLAVLV